MNLWEGIQVAFENVQMNKLRSLLTILGIVVGVMAVITVVSIGQAGKTSITSEISKFDPGYFAIAPVYNGDMDAYQNSRLTVDDMQAMSRIKGIELAVGSLTQTMTTPTVGKHKSDTFSIIGTSSSLPKIEQMNLVAGRFFSLIEEHTRLRVVVIESDYADKTFGSAAGALNHKLILNGKPYVIVGVVKSEQDPLSGLVQQGYGGYIPLPTALANESSYGNKIDIINFKTGITDPQQRGNLILKVKKDLAKRHNLTVDDYQSQTAAELETSVSSVFNILQVIIGSIAGISLFVGGIGVMNIMLVSVTERTREVGIRKALGATPGNIMRQFLIEAVILTFIGGLIGTVLGFLGAYVFSCLTSWPFTISWGTILLAVGFSAAVGIFFGLYPANKASKMQPIESLRYE